MKFITLLLLSAIVCSAQLIPSRRAAIIKSKQNAGGGGASTLLTGIEAYWNLDEASGNRSDSTASAQTLTDNNTVGSTAGKISNAARFVTASSEYLSRPDSTVLSVSGSFTWAFWFRTQTDQTASGFVQKQGEYIVKKDNNDNPVFTVVDSASGSAGVTDTGTTIANNTWYFIVAWYDNSDKSTHMKVNNGTTVDGTSLANGPRDAAGLFTLGFDDSCCGYDGDLDEVGFWKRVLTSTEMSTLYNSGNAVTYPFTGSP